MDKDGEDEVAGVEESLAESTADGGRLAVTARAGKNVLRRNNRGTFGHTRLQKDMTSKLADHI